MILRSNKFNLRRRGNIRSTGKLLHARDRDHRPSISQLALQRPPPPWRWSFTVPQKTEAIHLESGQRPYEFQGRTCRIIRT